MIFSLSPSSAPFFRAPCGDLSFFCTHQSFSTTIVQLYGLNYTLLFLSVYTLVTVSLFETEVLAAEEGFNSSPAFKTTFT